MATLTSAYGPSFSEKASILTGNPNRVTVEVENSVDIAFWKDLLSSACPQKDFHFNPFHTVLVGETSQKSGNGKAQIMQHAPSFNDWHIGCVDSDYDWLLSDKTAYGKELCRNKYLLQTYAYSFENLLCLAESLDCFCEEMTEESLGGMLRDYVEKLSRAVYPLLLWSIYLYGLDCHDFTPTAWHDVLVNTRKNPEDSLAEVEKQIGNKLKELEDMHARDCQEKDRLTTALVHSKSVTPENAYLFVRGHDLFDHVVNSVAGPIVSKLRQKHYNQLRESTDALKNDKLKKYQNKQESVRDLLYKNFRYKEESEFYDKIANDAKRIWS